MDDVIFLSQRTLGPRERRALRPLWVLTFVRKEGIFRPKNVIPAERSESRDDSGEAQRHANAGLLAPRRKSGPRKGRIATPLMTAFHDLWVPDQVRDDEVYSIEFK